jgi:putative Holliday junction resolvase
MTLADGHLLALDVGAKRIGVAIASTAARLPSPLMTLPNDDKTMPQLKQLCEREQVTHVVVGLPRGLDGQETAQTAYARDFAHMLASHLEVPISLIDEAVTSAKAEAELKARGQAYAKGDIDALAAVYMLEDYLNEGNS